MKKFEMYSEEYIFCESHTVSEKASPCAQLDIVQELRREFAEEKERYDTLSREKRELGALLKEMQSSLFDLRVSGQVLDSMNLQPLDDSVARLMQQVNQLTGLCSRADGINHIVTESTYTIALKWIYDNAHLHFSDQFIHEG